MPLTKTSTSRTLPREFLRDVREGLSASPKRLPCKYFYDKIGSDLFDRICDLPEYYPTRTERMILSRHAADMVRAFGPRPTLIEYGAGSGVKTRLLLDEMDTGAYVPVDISREYLNARAGEIARAYPHLEVAHVVADFTRHFELPALETPADNRVVWFAGSTIGNFAPYEAVALLRKMADHVGERGGVLIGTDLRKSPDVLVPAYDDAQGVTAAFNLNLLHRINRELGGDFVPEYFRHQARWNDAESRIEMHLVSLLPQTIRVGGEAFDFARGESICTEYSYKYAPEAFAEMARRAGLVVAEGWTDPKGWFAVRYLRKA